jgi:hypothetical protein
VRANVYDEFRTKFRAKGAKIEQFGKEEGLA